MREVRSGVWRVTCCMRYCRRQKTVSGQTPVEDLVAAGWAALVWRKDGAVTMDPRDENQMFAFWTCPRQHKKETAA